MAVHKLYASAFPEDALSRVDPSAQRRQSLSGVLQESVPDVQTIATEPGERVLTGSFTDTYADVMATELQELLAASDVIGEVPYFVKNENREWSGYYAPRQLRQGDRRDPRIGQVHRFTGALSFVGTRRSHVRAVKLTASTVTNTFGTATTETVWIPADASNPRWVHRPTGGVEDATAQTTRETEDRRVAKFDATEPTFSNEETYHLVYDIEYDLEWRVDPRVWDDYGRDREQLGSYAGDTVGTSSQVGTATVGSQTVVNPSWQRVYRTQHEYVGQRVLENGIVRLEPRPNCEELFAYRWEPVDSTYRIIQLGASDWRLIDFDITRIGLERVVFRTRWEDTANRGTTYELTGELRRGFRDVHWYEPDNASSSTPAGLVTRLDPIAHDSDTALGEAQTVLKRSDVPDE